jgi:hypothetical protein
VIAGSAKLKIISVFFTIFILSPVSALQYATHSTGSEFSVVNHWPVTQEQVLIGQTNKFNNAKEIDDKFETLAEQRLSGNYRLIVQHDIKNINGTPSTLMIKGYTPNPTQENFNIRVYNFTSGVWNTRMTSPFTTENAFYYYDLQPGEYYNGEVRIRYIDTKPTGDSVRNRLYIDFCGVKE